MARMENMYSRHEISNWGGSYKFIMLLFSVVYLSACANVQQNSTLSFGDVL